MLDIMTTDQKREILKRIANLQSDIEELKACRKQIAVDGYASASMSSGSGSKSYTKMDLAKITELIAELTGELKSCRSLLAGKSEAVPSMVYHIWY